VGKVQRLTVYHGVHPSGWKWEASLKKDEDIVWSLMKVRAAVNSAGQK